ncbi:MAG: hypothetical protein CSA36_03475 [Draconibacterium sp.]|nr:MAG: hypothetical protein CSA36_03475 [Draconibacterium sp.]
MKKAFFFTIVMAIVTFAGTVQAQSLNEILSKHFKVIGQDKLKDAESIYMRAKVNQMGMDLPMEMKIKHPNKFFVTIEMQGQKMIQVFDGETGWVLAPWVSSEPQELKGDALAQAMQQTNLEGELYNYDKKGSTAEFLGKVNVEGKDVYRIKLTTSDGNSKNYFIDVDTYLITKEVAKVDVNGQTVNVEQKMLDYKDFDGVKMATKIEQKTPMGIATITIEDVKFNVDFDDTIFTKPN